MMTAAPGQSPPAPAPKRRSGVVIPHRVTVGQRILARLIYTLIRLVELTLRFRTSGPIARFAPEVAAEPAIYVIWHNRLALSLLVFERVIGRYQKDRRLAALVSASRDGGLLARVLELFKVQPVRGSSSRRGAQALRELTTWSEKGYDLAITPDGPRGPCYRVQEGVIALAQLTGRTILPVSIQVGWTLRLRSWDRFQVPLPFARCGFLFGKPLKVPPDADEAMRRQLRADLEQRLMSITRD